MVNTSVTLCGITLDNPIIPASGTFGYGQEFAKLYDINILGTFSFKGTTREPRFGNPTPRIAEYAGGLLNSVGLQHPGIFPLAVRMVYQVYEAVRIPIVGMGGVSCAEDVLELMLAGATAVGVGAANLVDPFACQKIVEALPSAMAAYGIQDINDIIGGAHHG